MVVFGVCPSPSLEGSARLPFRYTMDSNLGCDEIIRLISVLQNFWAVSHAAPHQATCVILPFFATHQSRKNNIMSKSNDDNSYGFNLETLTCGGKFNKLISAFDFGSDPPPTDNDAGDDTYHAQWAANEERKKSFNITDAFQCDPRTCIRSNVKVATKGAQPCDPEVCRNIYFCEICARCPRHCDCTVENDPSICDSAEGQSQADSYKLSKSSR